MESSTEMTLLDRHSMCEFMARVFDRNDKGSKEANIWDCLSVSFLKFNHISKKPLDQKPTILISISLTYSNLQGRCGYVLLE
jgi:hypothetical protein